MIGIPPSDVENFRVPHHFIPKMEEFFQRKGTSLEEGVALLCGRPARNATVNLDLLIFPVHASWPMHGVTIPGSEINALNPIYETNGVILYCKVHTHPLDAYHSPVDDANPLMQFDGAVSIVLPRFCFGGFKGLRDAAVYRYTADGWRWLQLTQSQVRSLFTITPVIEGKIIDRTQAP